ncbi:MAG TPA: hypothetical protein VFT37_04760 [Telluria sp.]|nr:hypothetical protein [Telluria sp.]
MAQEIDRTNGIYIAAMQQARHWCGLLEVLIKRADSDLRAACMAPIGQERSNPSVADELVKLVESRPRHPDRHGICPPEGQAAGPGSLTALKQAGSCSYPYSMKASP